MYDQIMVEVCNWCIRFLYKASDYLGMSLKGTLLSVRGSPGSPSTRSPTMFLWISSDPPAIR